MYLSGLRGDIMSVGGIIAYLSWRVELYDKFWKSRIILVDKYGRRIPFYPGYGTRTGIDSGDEEV
ncbi:MAG: hypothetical protein ACP5KG_01730 [Myxococcota bacterium]